MTDMAIPAIHNPAYNATVHLSPPIHQNQIMTKNDINGKQSFIDRTISYAKSRYEYYTEGVWRDPRDSIKIRIIKTLNLTISSFLNKDLQSRSMSLTYVTALAIVPALALLFAIGRGFGLQDFIEKEIYIMFPSQSEALSTAMGFVDSYLKEASSGLFVGIGIIFLLWTVISLMGRIEDSFNSIWDVSTRRTFVRKITDYTAICLFIPILMIASSGVSIMVSTTLDKYLTFLSPLAGVLLDASPFILVWIAFTLCFILIPNTPVNFKYGVISGFIAGISFQILQLLFVNGQIYVSKYNAIYGSFAFLPLLLIWMQLSWLILLIGCILTYSAQNVFGYNFSNSSSNISNEYMQKVCAVVLAIIIRRFEAALPSLTVNQIALKYDLPVNLVKRAVETFIRCGLVNYVIVGENKSAVAPAFDSTSLTLGEMIEKCDSLGTSDFIPRFAENFSATLGIINGIIHKSIDEASEITLSSLPIPVEDTENR